jgi:hypothetical protein
LNAPLLTGQTVIDAGYTNLEFTSVSTGVGYFDDATLVTTPELASGAIAVLTCMGAVRRRKVTGGTAL